MGGGEADLQGVGEADDGGTAPAEATVDAVVVRAGGGGDGNLSAGDFYGVAAAVGGRDREGLVFQQGNGFIEAAAAVDFCGQGVFSGPEAEKAEEGAEDQAGAEKQDPGPCFHGGASFLKNPGFRGQMAPEH